MDGLDYCLTQYILRDSWESIKEEKLFLKEILNDLYDLGKSPTREVIQVGANEESLFRKLGTEEEEGKFNQKCNSELIKTLNNNYIKSDVVKFLCDEMEHPRGFTHAELLSFTDDQFERCHDLIQWLFPSDEPSNMQPDSPVLTVEDMIFLRSRIDTKVRVNVNLAFRRFLEFLGFEIIASDPNDIWSFVFNCGKNWETNKKYWLTKGRYTNHNLLRITRVIKCLNMLGVENKRGYSVSDNFYQAVCYVAKENPKCVSEKTLEFWYEAVNKDYEYLQTS